MERSANTHNTNRAGAYFVSAVALTLLWFAALSSEAVRRHAVKAAPKAAKAAAPVARYPVYPYSVVSGGVHSAADLQGALARDPVAAAHYSDFRANAAHTVTLPTGKMAYVSFRVRNEVYWTRKKILLPQGEQLITDGEHYARTRCGNRISDVPQPRTMPDQPAELLTAISSGELTLEESVPWSPEWDTQPSAPATPATDLPVGRSEEYPGEAPLPRAPSGGMAIMAPPSPGASTGVAAPASANVFSPMNGMPPARTYFAASPDAATVQQASGILYTPETVAAIQIPENRQGMMPALVVPPLTPLYPLQLTASTKLVHPSAPIPIPMFPPSAIPATPDTIAAIVPADLTKSTDIPTEIPAAPIVTPEPGTLLMLASALSALLCWRLKKLTRAPRW